MTLAAADWTAEQDLGDGDSIVLPNAPDTSTVFWLDYEIDGTVKTCKPDESRGPISDDGDPPAGPFNLWEWKERGMKVTYGTATSCKCHVVVSKTVT